METKSERQRKEGRRPGMTDIGLRQVTCTAAGDRSKQIAIDMRSFDMQISRRRTENNSINRYCPVSNHENTHRAHNLDATKALKLIGSIYAQKQIFDNP